MRASSSWIKLQFVVRKHVMNTYQMHTLSLFLFYHILSPSLPLPFSLIFLSFWLCLPSLQLISSLFFWWSVILMWHIQLYCIMYPFICTCVCICVHKSLRCIHCICDMYVRGLCVSIILLLLFIITSLSRITSACCLRLCANLSTNLSAVSVHFRLSLTLSQASVGMTSFAGCNGVGLVHWSGQGRTRIHSYSY